MPETEKTSSWSEAVIKETRRILESWDAVCALNNGKYPLKHITNKSPNNFAWLSLEDLMSGELKLYSRQTGEFIEEYSIIDDLVNGGWAVD